MALFLQESLEELEVSEISIEEAYEGLIDASFDMHELSESLLQADFIIHEQCKLLTEAEASDKKTSFLAKAVTAIKKFVITVRDKVVAFFTKIGSILSNLWKKLSETAKNVFVPEGAVEALTEAAKDIDNLQKASNSTSSNAKTYSAEINNKTSILNKSMEKLKFVFNKKDKEKQKSKIVPITSLKGIFQMTIIVAGAGKGVHSLLSKRAAKLDEGVAKVEEKQKVVKSAPSKEAKMSLDEAFAAIKEEQEQSRATAKANLTISKNTGTVTQVLGGLKAAATLGKHIIKNK